MQTAPAASTPPSYPGYSLVWADEFDGDGWPDPKRWTYERGFVRNRELQWYQPENARQADGLLIIEARRERVANPGYEAGASDWQRSREFAEYTSASLITRGLHSWQYGRFEMRGRIDTRAGLWPAFWTLGVAGDWPHNGEIDIMEYYRGLLLANVAWGGAKRFEAIWADSRKPIDSFKAADWANKFHVWRMDWDERAIVLSVDGERLNDVDPVANRQPGRHGRRIRSTSRTTCCSTSPSAGPRAAIRRRRRSRRGSRSTTCGCIRRVEVASLPGKGALTSAGKPDRLIETFLGTVGLHEPGTSDPGDARRAEDRRVLREDARLSARSDARQTCQTRRPGSTSGRGQQIHLVYVDGFEVSPFEGEFGRHVAVYYPRAQFDALKQRLRQHGAELIAAAPDRAVRALLLPRSGERLRLRSDRRRAIGPARGDMTPPAVAQDFLPSHFDQ